MSYVSKEEFQSLLEKAIISTIEKVQKEILEPLPKDIYFEFANFEYPKRKESLDEILSFIYKEGTFPRILDIAVRGVKDDCTIVWMRASHHRFVSDFDQTWNTPKGMGPFKILGLMLPLSIWERPRPLSLEDLKNIREM